MRTQNHHFPSIRIQTFRRTGSLISLQLFSFYYRICVVCKCGPTWHRIRAGGRGTVLWGWFSPSTMEVLGTELRSPGLKPNVFTPRAVLHAFSFSYKLKILKEIHKMSSHLLLRMQEGFPETRTYQWIGGG